MEQAPKQYSEAEVLKLLSSEGVTVIEQAKVELLTELDYSGFETEYANFNQHVQNEVDECAAMCREFLSGAVITDQFTDHMERRKWRLRMHQKYGDGFNELYKKNKLRGNSLYAVKGWLEALANGLRVFKATSEKALAVQSIATKFPDVTTYDAMTVDQKLELVKKVDDLCREFLDLVAKK